MKKLKRLIVSALTVAVAAASMIPLTGSATIDTSKDPNQDGRLTFADATYIIQCLAGTYVPSDYDNLDMDNNGIVSMVDVFLIENYMGGN
ncbi:MAG: hypothetical protein K2H19_06770 [Ruminococcus sp.]|nr:hypothetical protein [Ruminococcus sp.]